MKADEPSAADLFRAAVGDRVFLHRVAVSLTREELGRRAGLSANYVYRLEQGWANPKVTTLQAVATALQTTVASLLSLLDVDGEGLGVAAAAKASQSEPNQ